MGAENCIYLLEETGECLAQLHHLAYAIYALIGIVAALGLVLIIRSRGKLNVSRGTAPGQGASVFHASRLAGQHGAISSSYTVTKDPQQYAKSFAPGNADRKN